MFLLTAFMVIAGTALSQQKKEMEPAKETRTYNTAGLEKRKVENSYQHEERKSEVKVISRKTFESYPPEKRQAILSEPEKYIIED